MALIGVGLLMAVCSCIGVVAMAKGRLRDRTYGDNAYDCKRCGKTFQANARKGFPQKCAQCGARDWNS